jgi:hypothetical protein
MRGGRSWRASERQIPERENKRGQQDGVWVEDNLYLAILISIEKIDEFEKLGKRGT